MSTEPGATLSVNGESVETQSDGSYELPAVNSPGDNEFFVESSDAAGNLSSMGVRYEFVPPEGWIAAIGDSVMLGSATEIEKRLGEGIVDATVSRQFLNAPDLVAQMMARPDPPLAIIVGLGTNGPVQERHFEEVMANAGEGTLVGFVNVRMPRNWEATSNNELSAGVERYDNAVLVDWYSQTWDRDDLFAADGFHPRQPGRVIMADMIVEAIFPGWQPLNSE